MSTLESYGRRTGSSSVGNSEGLYYGITPFQRIEELEYFYTSDSVKNDKVIDVVDMKEKKKSPKRFRANGHWIKLKQY